MKKSKIEKFSSFTSSASGVLSFLGGYQVCHNLCLGIIAVLSLIGITIVGMPFLFLQKVAIPFWILAVLLLAVTLTLYFKKNCISKKLILFNFGIIIIGVPFQSLQKFSVLFWVFGGSLILISILIFIRDKLR